MPRSSFIYPTLAVLVLGLMLGVSSWVSPGTIVPIQQATVTTLALTAQMPEQKSWIIVDLPPDASQLEYGAEVYRLVCSACHGDKGQGLTDEWRTMWAPEDQNCWQSKSHGRSHPSDGFYMPVSPAVAGPPLMIFDTALDLYNYIEKYMPWYNRGSLTIKDAWSATAYILKLNKIDPGPDLNPETAAQTRLRALSIMATPLSATAASNTDQVAAQGEQVNDLHKVSPFWRIAIFASLALVLVVIYLLIRRAAQ